jgi:hypothetical protein
MQAGFINESLCSCGKCLLPDFVIVVSCDKDYRRSGTSVTELL